VQFLERTGISISDLRTGWPKLAAFHVRHHGMAGDCCNPDEDYIKKAKDPQAILGRKVGSAGTK
jgi:hypothetical protein